MSETIFYWEPNILFLDLQAVTSWYNIVISFYFVHGCGMGILYREKHVRFTNIYCSNEETCVYDGKWK